MNGVGGGWRASRCRQARRTRGTRVLVTLFVAFECALSSLAQVQTGFEDWRREPQAIRPARSTVFTVPCRRTSSRTARTWDPYLKKSRHRPGSLWLTARMSASKKSIYTEVQMNVEEVLRDPAGTIRLGTPLTIILGGGSLQLTTAIIFIVPKPGI